MLTATLLYSFTPGLQLQYSRAFKMTTPDGESGLLTRQIWTVLDDKDEFQVLQIEEEVLQRVGGLGDPPPKRRIFVDALGAIPESDDEATLWPLINLPEDSLEVGAAWANCELLPACPDPIEVDYRVDDLDLGETELTAVVSSQAELEDGQLAGQYRFSVTRGLLLEAALTLKMPGLEVVLHSRLLG